MRWLKENWQWLILNLFALAIMTNLLWHVTIASELNRSYDLLFLSSGKWAIRFLLLSLSMTPLNTLFGWRGAIKLRRAAGLWAFEFALLHFLLNVTLTWEYWPQTPIPDYIAALGVIGLSILTLMAATSFRWAMKHMGKWWKRLHRLVYAAGMIIVGHALLEAPNKRVAAYDSQAGIEIGLYLAILVLLLTVRIPTIRSALANLRYKQGVRREVISEK